MSLHECLITKFSGWRPPAPEVIGRSKNSISLDWGELGPFSFLERHLLYRLEMKDRMPPWVVTYSGGKTNKTINNLTPSHPQKFRLKIILKSTAISLLAEEALRYYGNESIVREKIGISENYGNSKEANDLSCGDGDDKKNEEVTKLCNHNENGSGEANLINRSTANSHENRKWLESQYSDETWTSTDTDGTTPACFCMAVHCGYLKQLQTMLEERPALIGMINSTNGFTPLATAVRKGDVSTVRFLMACGADLDQASSTGQAPLQLAALGGHAAVVELLLDRGANTQVRDLNGLRVEHYAVDSGDLNILKLVLDRGGDVTVTDNNGWTPLFRAVCQGAATALVAELVSRGSSVEVTDRAGLTLAAAAKLLRNRHGRSRDSIVRLVDPQFPHQKAIANFTRLTKKISSVHSILK